VLKRILALFLLIVIFLPVAVLAQDTPGTVKYPTALDSQQSLFEVANRANNALNGSITNSATTLTLNDASLFPSSGAISIDNEIIYYTGKSSNDLTGLVRGRDGTTAASHSNGATVSMRIIARHISVFNEVVRNIEAKVGTSPSTPVANSLFAGTGTGISSWSTSPTVDRMLANPSSPSTTRRRTRWLMAMRLARLLQVLL
jgi:hypothetical protein